jgi:hypothetical protein
MDYEHDKEKHTVKSVKEVVYVNIISKKDNANIVMVVHFVNTENQNKCKECKGSGICEHEK